MTTQLKGEHHVTIPLHKPIKVGTLASILGAASAHLGLDRQALIQQMRL
jgi:hypothetical protein